MSTPTPEIQQQAASIFAAEGYHAAKMYLIKETLCTPVEARQRVKELQPAPVAQPPESRFHQIAKACIARGERRVLPIEVGGKNPAIKWAANEKNIADGVDTRIDSFGTSAWTAVCEQWVEEQAARFPNLNGCVLAKPDEDVFIDCDTNAEFIAAYEEFAGEKFPVTYTTSARDNRTQMHFHQTDATRRLGNVPQFAVDGIEFSIRQRNLYVLAEGSQHPSGSTYVRVVDADIVSMPDKLVAFVEHLKAKTRQTESSESTTTFPKKVVYQRNSNGLIESGRHNATLQRVGEMHANKEYLTPGSRLEAIREWREKNIVNPDNDSEHNDKKLRAMVRDSFQWKPSGKLKYTQKPDAPAQPATPVTLNLIGEPRVFDPREYALKPLMGQRFSGWFPLGRITLVSASSGGMKTTFLAQALAAGRDGEAFLGHAPGNLPFLFLFADRGEYDCEDTFERMNLVGKIPFECINNIPRHAAIQVIADAANSGYKLLVIDGADLLISENNEGKHVDAFTQAVQCIAKHYGVGIIATTGAGKMSPQALKQGAERRSITKGSEVWGRTSGSVFTLNSEHDGTKDTRRLVVQHRNAATEKFLLEVQAGRLVAVDEVKLMEQSEFGKVCDWVEAREKFTVSEVKKHFKCSGTKATEWLTRLIKKGTIKRRKGKGANGRIWFEVPSVVKAMKDADREHENARAANTVNLDKNGEPAGQSH